MRFTSLLLGLCLGVVSANAAVVLESGGGHQINDDDSPTTSISNTGNAADYLVVVVTSESNEASTATYGGTGMTLIGSFVGTRNTQIFGLATTAGSGTVDISFASWGTSGGQGFGYAFLTGVTGVEATASSGAGGTISYNSDVSNGSLAIFGGGGNGSTLPSPTPADGILFTSDSQSGFGSFGTEIGYDANLSAGAYSTTISSGSDYFAGVVLVPEPTTLGLLALGGMGALIRRKKH